MIWKLNLEKKKQRRALVPVILWYSRVFRVVDCRATNKLRYIDCTLRPQILVENLWNFLVRFSYKPFNKDWQARGICTIIITDNISTDTELMTYRWHNYNNTKWSTHIWSFLHFLDINIEFKRPEFPIICA